MTFQGEGQTRDNYEIKATCETRSILLCADEVCWDNMMNEWNDDNDAHGGRNNRS